MMFVWGKMWEETRKIPMPLWGKVALEIISLAALTLFFPAVSAALFFVIAFFGKDNPILFGGCMVFSAVLSLLLLKFAYGERCHRKIFNLETFLLLMGSFLNFFTVWSLYFLE